MSKSKKSIIIATGGTGGHIFPAVALTKELNLKGYETIILADKRFIKYSSNLNDINFKIICTDRLSGSFFRKLLGFFFISYGILECLYEYIKRKPSVVVGFGGYFSIPAIIAAKLYGAKVILHEQNAILGRANNFLSKFASDITTCFKKTINANNPIYTGQIVSKNILDLSNKAYQPNKIKHILVMGGSQGSDFMGINIAKLLVEVGKACKIKITHQVRQETVDEVTDLYNKNNIKAEVKSFFHDIDKRLEFIDFVIARSGSATISEIAAGKKPSLLIPLASSALDHQLLNAQLLEQIGASILVQEKSFNQEILAPKLTKIISDDIQLKEMSKKAANIFKNGAQNIIKIIEKYY